MESGRQFSIYGAAEGSEQVDISAARDAETGDKNGPRLPQNQRSKRSVGSVDIGGPIGGPSTDDGEGGTGVLYREPVPPPSSLFHPHEKQGQIHPPIAQRSVPIFKPRLRLAAVAVLVVTAGQASLRPVHLGAQAAVYELREGTREKTWPARAPAAMARTRAGHTHRKLTSRSASPPAMGSPLGPPILPGGLPRVKAKERENGDPDEKQERTHINLQSERMTKLRPAEHPARPAMKWSGEFISPAQKRSITRSQRRLPSSAVELAAPRRGRRNTSSGKVTSQSD